MIKGFNKLTSLFSAKQVFTYPMRPFASSEQPEIFGQTNYKFRDLTKTLFQKLEVYSIKHRDLTNVLINDSMNMEGEALAKIRRDIEDLNRYQAEYENFEKIINDIHESQKLKAEAQEINDFDTVQLVDEEQEQAEEDLAEIEDKVVDLLIPPEEYDDCQAIKMEVRAGPGGSESALFAEEIVDMYQGYFNIKMWNSQIINISKDNATGRGCKNGSLKITGPDVYKTMKCESGVHKVQRVPETGSKGKLHSSTISVTILPQVPFEFKVNDKEIKIEVMRASGAGGQHVNKTESAVRVTHIPTGETVHIQEYRQQNQNKSKALDILKEKLFVLEYEKAIERRNRQRRSQVGTSDRSEKIRTYNFPNSRITDHRTNTTLYGMDKMLSGQLLQEFIDAYQEQVKNEKLQELLEEDKKKAKSM